MREDEIVPALDGWLGQVLHPDRIEATCEALVAAQTSDDGEEARLAGARRTLAECETKLACPVLAGSRSK